MSITVGGGLGVRISGGIVVGPSVGVSLSGNDYAVYLLRDDFATAEAAPLTSPRTAEPGPGTLTITDTNSKLSIADGKLTFATGGTAPDPHIAGTDLARAAGRAVVGKANFSNAGFRFGWGISGADVRDSLVHLSAQWDATRAGSAINNLGPLTESTDYAMAVVLRATGFFALVKGGAYTSWTVLWVNNDTTSTPLKPMAHTVDNTSVGTLDNFRVRDLPAPFNTDYGLATDRLAGSVSAGATFTHEADCVIEFTATTLPSSGAIDVTFRSQDLQNKWTVTVTSAGTLLLGEWVGGVFTSRASATGVVSAGHRVVVVADDSIIRGYSNNVLRWTYSSATNFATETDGSIGLGTGGAISNVVAWPRTLTGTAATILDQSVA